MSKIIFLDTETTGVGASDRLIQIGAVAMEVDTFLNGTWGDDLDSNIVVIDSIYNPNTPINIEAMSIHHITTEMVESNSTFKDSLDYSLLNDLLSDESNYLICHNTTFDISMIKKEGINPKCKVIDTLSLSRDLYRESPKHKLQYLRYWLNLYKEESKCDWIVNGNVSAHSALSDVVVLILLFKKMIDVGYSIDELLKKSIEPIKSANGSSNGSSEFVMPFGKYKGMSLTDLVKNYRSYATWAVDNMTALKEDVKVELKKLLDPSGELENVKSEFRDLMK